MKGINLFRRDGEWWLQAFGISRENVEDFFAEYKKQLSYVRITFKGLRRVCKNNYEGN